MTEKEMIEEMAKVLETKIVNKTWRSKSVARELYRTIVPEGAVVLTREEHDALINEFNALQHKYNDICDKYRLCKDANETIKQNFVIARKETAREIYIKACDYSSEMGKDRATQFSLFIHWLSKQFCLEVE